MTELSFKQVYDAVTLALHNGFQKNVYGAELEQGLVEDSFNVLPVSLISLAEVGERSRRTAVFDIIYYPPAGGGNEACLTVASELPSVISLVTAPGGAKLHSLIHDMQLDDEVLHCTVKLTYLSNTVVTPDTPGAPGERNAELMRYLEYSDGAR